ncbi:MAG: DNA gyrase C-terminal beta-propeller domain-containing protein, partial [Eubacterium sp.]|nr:DNA gyrase C-terminal beta-propeller domain-containing protein [Eubacterium sp.]
LLNNLYKHTQLEDTFGVNMLALVNQQPKVLPLIDMLKYYIRHQEDVVTRRTKFELAAAEKRAHIVEGLLVAIDNIDEVIKIIRAAANVNEAKEKLIERFSLSDAQAQAIVDMRLRALTGLERDKLEAEYRELQERIAYLKGILADEKKLLSVIKEEMQEIADKYGDDRRTRIGQAVGDFTDEDLIDDEPAVLTMTHLGYIKRMSVDNFHSQNRGGKGIRGIQTIEEDFIEDLLMTTTLNYILFFTNRGRVFRLRTYQIPEAGRNARGVAMVNLLQLDGGEHVQAVVPIRDFSENKYFIMVTKSGMIKKSPQMDYKNIRKNGLIGITIKDDDELIEVKTTDNTRDIFMVSKNGMCIRFKDTDIRSTGRSSMGVRGMNLDHEDEVIGMQMNTQGEKLLIVTEKGMGKKTSIDEFTLQRRGGKGLKCYKVTEKTGKVVGVKAVNEDHEVMLITTEGIIIQLRCEEISTYGRITSGVKLINLKNGETVKKIAKVRQTEKNNEEATEESEETDETKEVANTQEAEGTEETSNNEEES